MTKSTGTPYKMLKRMSGARSWHEIRKKLEEVYLPIATEGHAASNIHGNNNLMKHCKSISRTLQTQQKKP